MWLNYQKMVCTMQAYEEFSLEDIAIEQITYEAGLPRKGSLFRIHPSNMLQAFVIYYNKKWYLCNLSLISNIKKTLPFIPSVYHANLYQAIDSNNCGQIILISLGGSTGEDYLKSIEIAKEVWVERLNSNQVIFEPKPDYQKHPDWSMDFKTLINLAFKDCYIASLDHPILQSVLAKTS